MEGRVRGVDCDVLRSYLFRGQCPNNFVADYSQFILSKTWHEKRNEIHVYNYPLT